MDATEERFLQPQAKNKLIMLKQLRLHRQTSTTSSSLRRDSEGTVIVWLICER